MRCAAGAPSCPAAPRSRWWNSWPTILLTQPGVVPIDRPAAPWRGGAERSFARHTTRDMLAVEQAVFGMALASRGAGVAIAEAAAVEQAVAARPSLSGEQVAMVRRLTRSGAGVDIVVGKAGSGKSTALAAAREAWQASGTPVLGAAVAARAAIALSEAAGIPAMTVARLLTQMDHDAPMGEDSGQPLGHRGVLSPLPRGAVLVVDKAGMLPTRQLARQLAATTRVQGKLVLVGDHRQLPELAAGGAFRALARRLDPAVLSENRRQQEPWERDALDHLRSGQIEPALQAYAAAGRVVTSGTSQLQKDALVTAWWAAQQQPAPGDPARDGVVMLAARRADVADLNTRAHALMAAHGRLTGPTVHGDGPDGQRHFAAGDVVIARRNDYTAGIFNGQRGVITHVDPDGGTATLRIDDHDVVVGRRYLQAGNLDHGYALTIHQAQGLTTGRALVLGNDSLYRESGYVALSRGRVRNDLHLADRPDNLDPLATESHTPQTVDHQRPDPTADLTQTLQRSRAQTMALDQLTRNQSPAASIDL